MSSNLSLEELQSSVSDSRFIRDNAFSILKSLSSLCGNEAEEQRLQELILRLLQHRECFNGCGEIFNSLVREVGLFPFLEPEDLGFADRIAYEFHKPENMEGTKTVFHRPQARVYHQLMEGKSIILSAPTSFGKSLIIDAVVASQKFNNILIIVPTIALIDETRRRLTNFGSTYKIITHTFQPPAERNVFVLTQERALELQDLNIIDFFVVDEFYKLDFHGDGDDRAALLNQAFYSLIKKRKQFYMLGPNVLSITAQLDVRLECTFLRETYQTVVSEVHRVERTNNDLETLANLCKNLSGPTIIFCQSPQRVAEVTKFLIERNVGKQRPELKAAANWIGREFHPDWHVARATANGIGVHHGRIPRALAQFIVRSFDAGHVQLLVCTSTLIEGVNTKAENVIIFDNKINKQRYDYFTFNNIRGRSGRMFKHFIGHVYIFHDPPPVQLPVVDIPAFTQSDDTPGSLLIQLDDEDLTVRSRVKLNDYRESPLLSYATLKANVGVSLEDQLDAARAIIANLGSFHQGLCWTGTPTWEQLLATCQLIWDSFHGSRLAPQSVVNSRQLATRINQLKATPSIASLIQRQIDHHSDPDKAVGEVLDFLRLWANFHFPRLLRALDRIQKDVFIAKGLPWGDYEQFASRVESLFIDHTLLALDEYGIPIQLARKLESALRAKGDLDEVLRRVKSLDRTRHKLSQFEMELLKDAQDHITIGP